MWYSEDGIDWQMATGNAGFSGRWYHASIAYKMLVIGGTGDGVNGLNDVWSSEDGITWKQETGNAGFSKRYGHKCSLICPYIECYVLVIGGRNGDTFYNDIWLTGDEKTWKKIEHNCPFNPRAGFGLVTEVGSFIKIFGGYNSSNYLNDSLYMVFETIAIY